MDKIFKEHFDKYAALGKLPPEISIPGVKPYTGPELDTWRNNRKGIDWTDAKGNILKGAVDNVLVKGDKLIVLDYKTRGFALKDDTAAHYQNQIDIYNLLLRKNGRSTCDYAYLLFFHPKEFTTDGNVVFNKDLVKMTVDVASAERLWKKALKVLHGKMPLPAKECEWCKWREEK
jgi:hypothetical protein